MIILRGKTKTDDGLKTILYIPFHLQIKINKTEHQTKKKKRKKERKNNDMKKKKKKKKNEG